MIGSWAALISIVFGFLALSGIAIGLVIMALAFVIAACTPPAKGE